MRAGPRTGGEPKPSYALTEDGKGGVMLHRANCTYARTMAAIGRPVMTMYECDGPTPKDIKRHSCLDNDT